MPWHAAAGLSFRHDSAGIPAVLVTLWPLISVEADAGWLPGLVQDKLSRATTLAEEREALSSHIRKTLEAQELRVKQVLPCCRLSAQPEDCLAPQ